MEDLTKSKIQPVFAPSPAQDLASRIRERGEAVIEELIKDQKLEEEFIDFKNYSKDHNDNRNNLAKAISGFGNTSGGVLIWGVNCPSKGALHQAPFENYARFCENLNSEISRLTEPPLPGVHNFQVPSSVKGKGYVITVIPKSDLPPHQVIKGKTYYMRVGDSFTPIPHGILESMFGRAPHPALQINYVADSIKDEGEKLVISFTVILENPGRIIVNSHWLTISNYSDTRINILLTGRSEIYYEKYGFNEKKFFVFSKPHTIIAPTQACKTVFVDLELPLSFKGNLEILLEAGADNALPQKIKMSWSKNEIENLCEFYKFRMYAFEELEGKFWSALKIEQLYP